MPIPSALDMNGERALERGIIGYSCNEWSQLGRGLAGVTGRGCEADLWGTANSRFLDLLHRKYGSCANCLSNRETCIVLLYSGCSPHGPGMYYDKPFEDSTP